MRRVINHVVDFKNTQCYNLRFNIKMNCSIDQNRVQSKVGQYAFNTKLPFRPASRYKLIYMPKQSQGILVSPLYNFPLHREAGNVNQAKTSAINCVCEFRFSSHNIFFFFYEAGAPNVKF